MNELISLLQEKLDSIRAKIAELRETRAQVDRELRRHEDYLMHVEALLKEEIAQAQGQLPEQRLFPPPVVARLPREHKSIPRLVADLLAEKGRPMHADEIRTELEARGYKFSAKDPKASVVTALIRGKKKGQFEQVGRNTFRLSVVEHKDPLLETEGKDGNLAE